jgi:hypothetical protein
VKHPWTSAVVALFVAAGAAIAAAPGQVARPGEISRAEVWVQNGKSESIPVTLHDVDADRPVRVTVWNGAPSSPPPPPVPVRVVGQQWEYQTARVTPDNAAGTLTRLGSEGWETTGIAWTSPDGTTLLMKRTR